MVPVLGFMPDLQGVSDTDWWQACHEFWHHLYQGDGNHLREARNPSMFHHFVETLRPPNYGKDVSSLVAGNHLLVNNLLRNETSREWSCKFRHNSTSTFDWKGSVGDGFLKYQNASFQGNLPELFFSKCQNAVNGHSQSEFLTFCFKPAFCI